MKKVTSIGRTSNSIINKYFTSIGNNDIKIDKVKSYKVSKEEVNKMVNDIYKKNAITSNLNEQLMRYKKNMK